MAIEYYLVPKGKVTFGQLKSDVKAGKINGVTIYDSLAKPNPMIFTLDDFLGNYLHVEKVEEGVRFSEDIALYNNVSGILRRLMAYYGFKVLIGGNEPLGEFGPEDFANNMPFNNTVSNIPQAYIDVFKNGVQIAPMPRNTSGTWGRKYRYIKYRTIDGEVSRII